MKICHSIFYNFSTVFLPFITFWIRSFYLIQSDYFSQKFSLKSKKNYARKFKKIKLFALNEDLLRFFLQYFNGFSNLFDLTLNIWFDFQTFHLYPKELMYDFFKKYNLFNLMTIWCTIFYNILAVFLLFSFRYFLFNLTQSDWFLLKSKWTYDIKLEL